MAFARFTRPDDSLFFVNPAEVVHFAPVPESGPLKGVLADGTRIVFRNEKHQNVKELVSDVAAALNTAVSG